MIFSIDDYNNWKKFLDEEGYVVINNILSENERKIYFDLFKTDFNKVSPNFNFNDKSTWIKDNIPLMYAKGMALYSGLPQCDSMWYLRLNKNIKKIFSYVHNTNELITSMDGFSVFLKKDQKPKSWLHIDQNPNNKIYSIQGSYNYFKVNNNDSGFICVPKSHRFYKPKVNHKRNWIVLSDEEKKNLTIKKILIPENCFTLWNSKTIHCNIGMNKSNIELNRLTSYITMFPKKLETTENRLKRIKAYYDSDGCSHWAFLCELKKYPYGFKTRYENKGFIKYKSKINENGKIPEDRFNII